MTVRMNGQSYSFDCANSRGEDISSHHNILQSSAAGCLSSDRFGAGHAKKPDCRGIRAGFVTSSDFRLTDGGFLPLGGAPVTRFNADYEHRNNFQVPFCPLQYGTHLDRGGLSTQEASYSNHVRAVDYVDYGGERDYGLQDYEYGFQRMSHYGNENNFYRNSSCMAQNISRKDCMYQVENHNYLRPVEQHYVDQGGIDECNYRWKGNCNQQVSSSDRFEYLESRSVREMCSGSTNHESRQTRVRLGPATPYCFNHDVVNHENSRGNYSSQVASSSLCFQPARSVYARGQEDCTTQDRGRRDLRSKQKGDSSDYDEPLDLRCVNQDYTNRNCGDYGESLRCVNHDIRQREGFLSGNREAIQLNGFASLPINQDSNSKYSYRPNVDEDPYYVFGVPKTINTGDVQGSGCLSYPDHGLHGRIFENYRTSTESTPSSANAPRPSTGDTACRSMLHAKTTSDACPYSGQTTIAKSSNIQSPRHNFPGNHDMSPFSPFDFFLSSFVSTFASPTRFVETSDVTDPRSGTVQDGGALCTNVSCNRVSGTEDQSTIPVANSSTPRNTKASENSFGTQVPNVVAVPAFVQNTSVPVTNTGSTVVSCASAATDAKVPGKTTQVPGKGTKVPRNVTKVPGKGTAESGTRSYKARSYRRSQKSGCSHSSSTDDVLLINRFRPILPKPVTETSKKEPETGKL